MRVFLKKIASSVVLACFLFEIVRFFLISSVGLIDHGADEVVEAEITLRGVGGLVYRSLRVGTGAASRRELGFVTHTVVGEQGEGFLFREVLGTRRKDRDGGCFFGFLRIEDFFGHKAGLAEKVDVLQFRALRRVLLVVTRIADGIGFLHAFMYNTTVFSTVLLHAVDDAFAFECAVDLTDRVFKDCFCHIVGCFLIRQTWRILLFCYAVVGL